MKRISLLLPSVMLILATAQAMAAADDKSDKISLEFASADIESVVKAFSQITGKHFLIDPRVKGVVNIVSGKPVPRELAYQILLSALRLQGFAVVEEGGVAKVLPEADAKTHAAPVARSKDLGTRGERMVTQVFEVRNESAAQLVPVLRPLVANNNVVSAYPNNTLVVTDYADNVRRIARIIESLDVPHGEDPDIIPLKYASAYDLAQTLNRLFAEGGGGAAGAAAGDSGQRATIVADGRSNSLIVRSDNAGKIVRVRNLVASLDKPTAVTGNIHVVYLKNAEATKVAQTLRGILAADSAMASGVPSAPSAASGSGGAASTAASAPTGSTAIQADSATNAVIITAAEPVYNNLRGVIDLLDKRRAQVQIEALVVELSMDKAAEFGIQWQNITGSGTRLVGGTNFGSGGANIVGLMENVAKAKATGTLGVASGLNVGIVSGDVITALLRALESDSQANILSAPNIVTLDNEEAKIVIGQNVPFITGAYAQTGAAATPTPFQTFERRDVGISLRVKPQISEGGSVRLQIYQEASTVQASTLSNTAGPITNKRALESAVQVDDGALLALGGLIDDHYNAGEDKVPLLGDAPVIGSLFRYQNRRRTKTNLMVFLRPTILRDAVASRDFSNERYDLLLGEQRQTEAKRRPWPGEDLPPHLPPRVAEEVTAK